MGIASQETEMFTTESRRTLSFSKPPMYTDSHGSKTKNNPCLIGVNPWLKRPSSQCSP